MTKTSLTAALSRAAARTPRLGRTENPALSIRREHLDDAASSSLKAARPKGREGKKVISGFFDPEASKQLARLAIDQDRSNEDLLREALNDLFTKYQLPPIA